MVAVLADDTMVEEIRNTIIMICSTRQIGGGMAWAVPIETPHRIRNGADMLAR